MVEKRYSHDGVVIIDHLKKDLIHIDGKEGLLELAEYVDKLQDENEQLRKENDMLFCELSVSANKEISRNCRIAELEEENEQLKQHNVELINKIDFLERVIDGDV